MPIPYHYMDSYKLAQSVKYVESNQISLIGLLSSKDYNKRPGGVVGVCGKDHSPARVQCVQRE